MGEGSSFCLVGNDWLGKFMMRNKLSIRVPEATSLARQAGFNKTAVERFYDNLVATMDKSVILPSDLSTSHHVHIFV